MSNKLHDIATDIAEAHITNQNAKFQFVTINEIKGSFLAVVSHASLNSDIEEVINTNGLPLEVAEEYIHCRIHGLAAKLIAKLYPEKL